MSNNSFSATTTPIAVALPAESQVVRYYESTDLADAYAIHTSADSSTAPELLARFLFSNRAAWVATLMDLRDLLASGFGLKTAKQLTATSPDQMAERIGIFRIYSASEHEIVVGEDDSHQDFRLLLLCTSPHELHPHTHLSPALVHIANQIIGFRNLYLYKYKFRI